MRLTRFGVHFKSIIERAVGQRGWDSVKKKENKQKKNRSSRSKMKQALHIKKFDTTD
jgi:hypothetical protein